MPLKDGAINEILPFAAEGTENSGDVLPLDEYDAHLMRRRGHQPGIAERSVQNTVNRQVAHFAAGTAQFLANCHAAGIKDDGDLDKIENAWFDTIVGMIGKHAPQPEIATTVKAGLAPRLARDEEVENREGIGLVSAGQLSSLGLNAFFSQTSGEFTVPKGVTRLFIILTGGGGSGSIVAGYEGGGGSAGGTCIDILEVMPEQSIPYIIGAGGIAPRADEMVTVGGPMPTYTQAAGRDGGMSSCLHLEAQGGKGGIYSNTDVGMIMSPRVSGGQAEGGLFNFQGGAGGVGIQNTNESITFIGGDGGTSFWGPGGCGSVSNDAGTPPPVLQVASLLTQEDLDGKAPGSGGGCRSTCHSFDRSGFGADGAIVILY